jgi:ubiquinone/menaquinone biosynthesis C-methylase UbiE
LSLTLGAEPGYRRFYGQGTPTKLLESSRIRKWSPSKRNAAKAATKSVSFFEAESECIPIGDCEVDLVTCSQSFHWMQPQKTLAEFARILKTGGIVAVYDCDWPPSVGQSVERSFARVMRLAIEVLEHNSALAKQWPKSKHLAQLAQD